MFGNISAVLIENYSLLFIAAACILAALADQQYKFVSRIVALEFILHELCFNYFFVDVQLTYSSFIYMVYMVIQLPVIVLICHEHKFNLIALLITVNLAYNFFTVLQHLQMVDFFDFHEWYWLPSIIIMTLELVLMAGMTRYVQGISKLPKYLNINYIDNLLRNRYRSVTWNKNRAVA